MRTLQRIFHNRSAAPLVIFLALAILTTGIAVIGIRSSDARTNQPSRMWPSFTMTYTVTQRNPTTGQLTVDQTHRLDVADEYTWRDEIIRDGINPQRAGTWVEFRGGVATSHDTYYKRSGRSEYGRGVTTNITPELNPVLLPNIQASIQAGRPTDWRIVPAAAAGRIAVVQHTSTPCPSPAAGAPPVCPAGVSPATSEQSIEFDASSVNQTYHGGIAVDGRQTVNGVPVRTFHAGSLQIRSR